MSTIQAMIDSLKSKGKTSVSLPGFLKSEKDIVKAAYSKTYTLAELEAVGDKSMLFADYRKLNEPE